jgi:hypothetical protein
VDVVDILELDRPKVLQESFDSLQRSVTGHYAASGEEFTRERLAALLDVVIASVRDRNLTTMVTYAEGLAAERFHAGFDISEVQTAFNSLEESLWRHLIAEEPANELAEAIGLLSTVLGAGKDALARTYVSLARHRHVPTLDLTALFEGTER